MDKANEHTLLIVDDSQVLRGQVVDFMKGTGLFTNYLEAENGLEGFKVLLNNDVDVVLCDLEMPGMDGLKFLGMHNAREELKDIPVIMLTGHGESEKKIKGLEQGASDYITKPFDAGELIARVKVQLKIKSLQDDLKEQNRQLEQISNTDALTQLANRRFLMESIEKEYQRSLREENNLSLIMADIDHFKKINDTYGHQEGDVALKTVARIITEQLRDYDIAARFGGEEFAIVLPNTALGNAVQVASRIRKKVEAMSFQGDLRKLKMTISLGVSSSPQNKVEGVSDLIKLADDALYSAKKDGRNKVVIADID